MKKKFGLIVSMTGYNFKLQKLTELNLKASKVVLYKNRVYITANRYHNYVELYQNVDDINVFYKVVKMEKIRLVKCSRKQINKFFNLRKPV